MNNKKFCSKSCKRNTRIISNIKKCIVKYVTNRVNFDYKKLIMFIDKKYNTSIYRILKDTTVSFNQSITTFIQDEIIRLDKIERLTHK